jgi:hypothetical protein
LTGTAVCEGYASLLLDLAASSGVKGFEILKYSNFAKGFGYDPMRPPLEVKSNHASVVVVIDGHTWLCEPTWAAGYVDVNKEFHRKFNPRQFLRPLMCTMNDHFPMNDVQRFFRRPYTYARFVNCAKYSPTEYEFRNESHPFAVFEVLGYVKIQFSIKHTMHSIFACASEINGDSRTEIERDLQMVELIEQIGDRSRWFLHAVFPSTGFYMLGLYINTHEQTEMFINNRQATSDIPFLRYQSTDEGFIPIQPLVGVTKIDSGFALIRFAVFINRSNLLVTMISPTNQEYRDLSQYIKLLIPSDDSRFEDVVIASFPAVGRWLVKVWLENDFDSFTLFVTYRFDVTCAIDEVVSPLTCIPRDRQIVPLDLPDDLYITPNDAAVVLNSLTFEVKAEYVGIILFNLRPFGGNNTIFPTERPIAEEGYRKLSIFEFSVPTPGIYRLLIWLGDECHVQFYALGLPRRNVDWVGLKKKPPTPVPVSPQVSAQVSGTSQFQISASPSTGEPPREMSMRRKISESCLLL